MTTKYITFRNSNSTVTKYFRVLVEGYDDGMLEKTTVVQRTIGGTLDVSQGSVHRTWTMVLRVRNSTTEPETGYGTLADLEYFYGLNNPSGTPSDKITFIDHHGTSRTVVFTGQLQKTLLSADISGDNAWFVAKVGVAEI